MKWIFPLLILVLIVPTVSASNFLNIKVKPLSGGDIVPDTTFEYVWNLTTDSACSNVLLSNSSNITTNTGGEGVTNINITNLVTTPSYLCEYRNGVLRKTHDLSTKTIQDVDRLTSLSGVPEMVLDNDSNDMIFNWTLDRSTLRIRDYDGVDALRIYGNDSYTAGASNGLWIPASLLVGLSHSFQGEYPKSSVLFGVAQQSSDQDFNDGFIVYPIFDSDIAFANREAAAYQIGLGDGFNISYGSVDFTAHEVNMGGIVTYGGAIPGYIDTLTFFKASGSQFQLPADSHEWGKIIGFDADFPTFAGGASVNYSYGAILRGGSGTETSLALQALDTVQIQAKNQACFGLRNNNLGKAFNCIGLPLSGNANTLKELQFFIYDDAKYGMQENAFYPIEDNNATSGTSSNRWLADYVYDLNAAGYGNFTYNVSASHFIGDGSQLTGIVGDGFTSIDQGVNTTSSPQFAGLTLNGNLAFDTITRTIAGIQNQNLVDKSAIEYMSSAWIFNGSAAGSGVYFDYNGGTHQASAWFRDPDAPSTDFYDINFDPSDQSLRLGASVFITGVVKTAGADLFVDGSINVSNPTSDSIADIISTNLLDKTAQENVTEEWIFDKNITVEDFINLKANTTAIPCNSGTAGGLYTNSTDLFFCNSTDWRRMAFG